MNLLRTMLTATVIAATTTTISPVLAQDFIGRQQPVFKSDRMTPENLWAMGRIGGFKLSHDNSNAVYGVTYYSVKQNKSHSVLYTINLRTLESKQLTTSCKSEVGGTYINKGRQIMYLSAESGSNQLWVMNSDGTNRKQISHTNADIADFSISPDEKKVIVIMDVAQNHSIQTNDADLPQASGMVINDLMYKHWDTYVTTAPHPFVADFDGNKIDNAIDILEVNHLNAQCSHLVASNNSHGVPIQNVLPTLAAKRSVRNMP